MAEIIQEKEGVMQYQLTVELPEHSIAQLKIIPNATKVLSKVIQEAIDREAVTTKTGSKPAKWALYANTAPAPLNGASKHIMKCSKDFKEEFAFKHDLTEEK